MNESSKNDKGTSQDLDDVGRLINFAGAREDVDPARMELVRERVASHWEHVVEENQKSRQSYWPGLLSVAAGIAVIAIVSVLYLQRGITPVSLEAAKIDRVLGPIQIAGLDANTGFIIEPETLIETGPDSRLALRMKGGKSLRVDVSSRLLVHSANHVSLKTGAIYIDTHGAIEEKPILVSTAMGSAQDIGTQFQVRLTSSELLIGVRDGLVQVEQNNGSSLDVNEGQILQLSQNGDTSQKALDQNETDWTWIESVVPEFDLQGSSLDQYLEWYANEKGLELQWADDSSHSKARKVKLSGSIDGSSLDEGLNLVQQIAPFDIRPSGETLWVRVQ